MFKAFFDTTRVDAFAAEVVKELQRQLPPAEVNAAGKAVDRRRDKAMDSVARKIEQLADQGPLNFFQKAKLGTRLQAALEEAGYPAEFAKTFSYNLAVQFAQGVAARGR